ncbi:cytochrome b [Komagataeibacter swingsii]|nr:cytochrome b/b6 domain-containing protein [Komagataeibacter swingsii]GBQ63933.1 cytochrome B561 [Komagataeibacter swingsii DSM 16373]
MSVMYIDRMEQKPSPSPARYDLPTIVFHWSCAAIIVLQFATANIWGLFRNPLHHQLVVTHLTLGIILSMLMPARLLWRMSRGRHIRAADRWLDAVLARSVEYGLYGLVLLEIILGYLWRWGNGQPMSFLAIQIPPPFGRFSASTVDLLHWLHQWNGWLIIILATGHGLAACFHYFILRDDVFQRMLVKGTVSDEYGK